MESLELTLRLVGGVALILANGFFVAIEFALTRARQFTEEEFVEDGVAGLERAWEMTQDLELYLTTCQVGITASSIAVGIVAEPALAALFEPLFPQGSVFARIGAGALIAYFIINLVHLTHGEQTPTYLGVERSRFVCRYGAIPLHWFYVLISPVIRLGDYVAKWTLKLFGVEMSGAWLETEEDVIESRAELRNRLGSVLEEGEMSDERVDEVLAALDIGEKTVADVMVDPEDVVALSVDDDVATTRERMADNPHARYPLIGEDLADLRGVVYTPVLLRHLDELTAGELDLESVAAPPMTASPDITVADLIDRFQAENQELAVVIEDGEAVGMVTATDAFEAITGDLQDPLDLELSHVD